MSVTGLLLRNDTGTAEKRFVKDRHGITTKCVDSNSCGLVQLKWRPGIILSRRIASTLIDHRASVLW